MRFTKHLRRRAVTWATAGLAVTAVAGALSLTAASAAPVTSARHSGAFTFALMPSPGIKSCLPHAGGRVTIIPGSQNDTMEVSIFGMPRNADFDLFVIEQPNKPFGVSWYQTDVNADRHGFGHATVRGVFDARDVLGVARRRHHPVRPDPPVPPGPVVQRPQRSVQPGLRAQRPR